MVLAEVSSNDSRLLGATLDGARSTFTIEVGDRSVAGALHQQESGLWRLHALGPLALDEWEVEPGTVLLSSEGLRGAASVVILRPDGDDWNVYVDDDPERGPLLIMSGEADNTVPWKLANAAYKKQAKNPGVTEIVEIDDAGHSLVIDHRWEEVANTALAFLERNGLATG